MHINPKWQETSIRLLLLLFSLGFWQSEVNLITFPLLVVAWIVDGGLLRFRETIREPFVQALFVLCLLLLAGLSWSEQFGDDRMKWLKYFVLLIFVPYYSLLNQQRLRWALSGLLVSYIGVVILGSYQWIALDAQGVPLLAMSYLSFSAMLGVGFVTIVGISCANRTALMQTLLWVLAFCVLLVQFHQNSRIFLFAALASVMMMFFCYYKAQRRRLTTIVLLLSAVTVILALHSAVFQERWMQIKSDFELLQQGRYDSSLGYRIAMWDVGLHGIAERPWLGHGTGSAKEYFESTIQSYREGLYKDLPKFQKTSHFHNDWIEIGIHLGLLGILALAFLFWNWYFAFQKSEFAILGIGLSSYMLLAGLTDTFLIFSRTPLLVLMITAIAMRWRQQ
jgi:O-antigen ligase